MIKRDDLNEMLDEFLREPVAEVDGDTGKVTPPDMASLQAIVGAIIGLKYGDTYAIDVALNDPKTGSMHVVHEPRDFGDNPSDEDIETRIEVLSANATHAANLASGFNRTISTIIRNRKRERSSKALAVGRIKEIEQALGVDDLDLVRELVAALRADYAVRILVDDELGALRRRLVNHHRHSLVDDYAEIGNLLVEPDALKIEAAKARLTDLIERYGPDACAELITQFNDAQHVRRKAARAQGQKPSEDLDSINPFYDPQYGAQ